MNKDPLIIICGPTAVGKSLAAVSLAEGKGEIISADSMQVYKFMDIGTAKPDSILLKRVKHHLISVVEPDFDFSAFDFTQRAKAIIERIYNKNRIPFVAGGTGLYIRSLIYGLSEAPGKNKILRKRLDDIQSQKGLNFLYQKLKKIDPDSAVRIQGNDRSRIIRALEIYYLTKKPFSHFIREHNKIENYNALWIGLNLPRDILYDRINKRTEFMYRHGLIEETKGLLAKGYSEELLKQKGIGYKEVLEYIQGKRSLQNAVEETAKKTRNYAKRQLTWFRKEKKIKWFSPDETDEIKKYIDKELKDISFNS